MTEPFAIFFLFLGVIAITAVVFGVWVIVNVFRFVLRGFMGLFCCHSPQHSLIGPTVHCPRRGCHAVNPVSARFCRRCGRELLKHEIGQAAMW
jgi:hypothetical protein